jgi:hypothetical protein
MLRIQTIFDRIWMRLLKISGSGSDFSKGPDPDLTFQTSEFGSGSGFFLIRKTSRNIKTYLPWCKKEHISTKKIYRKICPKNYLGQNPATDLVQLSVSDVQPLLSFVWLLRHTQELEDS